MKRLFDLNKEELIDILKNKFTCDELTDIVLGLERETIRVKNGRIASTPHPKAFEPKEKHKYITTDFGEAQMEFITLLLSSSDEIYNFTNTLYDISALELEDEEILWPYSMPCYLEEDEIKLANFTNNENLGSYRKYLSEKYGKKKQLISGIHYNFSFGKKFLTKFLQHCCNCSDCKNCKSEIYLKIARNYRKLKFLFELFYGATPICDESFAHIDEELLSIRTSEYGYRNIDKLNISYNSVKEFISTVKTEMKNGNILDEREIYCSVRLKTGTKSIIEDLPKLGVEYVEIRTVDINPYEKCGISKEALDFLSAIMMYCFVKEEVEKKYHHLNNLTGIFDILTEMKQIFQEIGIDTSVVDVHLNKLKNEDFLYKKIKKDINNKGYHEFFMEKGKQYKKEAFNNRFKLYGYEDLELSTQILMKEALKKSYLVDVIDRNDNFISISNGEKTEYIKQATKTSLDNYISVLAMENKVVTKEILKNGNIRVPFGGNFTDKESAFSFAMNLGKNFVVKPKSTNFGLGINIFKNNIIKEDVIKSIEIAFNYDKDIIIEEYIEGTEYRFLVIGDNTVGVLERVPANVIGNGTDNIIQLVEEKNKNPLRGYGYTKPLEKIKIDENVKIFLSQQGLDERYVPKDKQQIFLRQNSNISTGGDSIDLTDDVHPYFKELAVKATKEIGAYICGVDIIIEDYKDQSSPHGIIELNFNPAIHIHSFPAVGKERNISEYVLSALFGK